MKFKQGCERIKTRFWGRVEMNETLVLDRSGIELISTLVVPANVASNH